MTAPAWNLDPAERFCDEASCGDVWRVQLPGDGGRWCRAHAVAGRVAYESRVAARLAALPAPEPRPCSLCSSSPARLYPAGWRCDACAPGAPVVIVCGGRR